MNKTFLRNLLQQYPVMRGFNNIYTYKIFTHLKDANVPTEYHEPSDIHINIHINRGVLTRMP
jgi:hypothetical protein